MNFIVTEDREENIIHLNVDSGVSEGFESTEIEMTLEEAKILCDAYVEDNKLFEGEVYATVYVTYRMFENGNYHDENKEFRSTKMYEVVAGEL